MKTQNDTTRSGPEGWVPRLVRFLSAWAWPDLTDALHRADYLAQCYDDRKESDKLNIYRYRRIGWEAVQVIQGKGDPQAWLDAVADDMHGFENCKDFEHDRRPFGKANADYTTKK